MAGNTRRAPIGATERGRSVGDVLRRWARPLHVEALEDRLVPSFVQGGIPNWFETGPYQASNGQVTGITGTSTNPVDGEVQSVAPDPNDANTLFVAGGGGGVWRTTSALAANPTWTPLTDQIASLSVGDMDLDPANPNRLAAGTGRLVEGTALGGDLIGLVYSSNALAATPTFSVLGYGSLDGLNIRAVLARTGTAADGTAVPYLLAAGNRVTNAAGSATSPTANQIGAIYRSLDGGATWTPLDGVGGLPAATTASSPTYYDAVSDPADPKRVYVVTGAGVFRTDDITAASPAWTDLTTAAMGFASVAVDNAKLAIHNGTDGNVVYLAVASGDLVSVNYTTDHGTTWSQMDLPQSLTDSLAVSDASFETPIKISAPAIGSLANGDKVYIQGVTGNLGANGVWTVANVTQPSGTTPGSFTLVGSAATGVYTGGGTFSRIFFTNPNGASFANLSLVADPGNANYVYIGGGRQDFLDPPGPNQTGATAYTANIYRGDRSQTPGFGAYLQSPQWTPVTGSFAAGTSPRADSQAMAFDAQGNLIEGDVGGVYKRVAPQSSTGSWVSLLGNLNVALFTGVAYDSTGNVVFGGTINDGVLQQAVGSAAGSAAGSTSWETAPTANGGRLIGPGGQAAADNTSTAGQTVRFQLTGSGLFRNTYNANGTLLSTARASFTDPSDPTMNILVENGDSVSETTVYALNAVDPRLGMLGVTNLYEDNDPSPTLGGTFDVAALVTPDGMTGTVTAIAYGGKQILSTGEVNVSRIAYVGTSDGTLFIRGAAGGFFQATLPTTASGAINSIVVDPDDYRTAYVLVGGTHVYVTHDDGATFTDVTANLVATTLNPDGTPADGLSTQISTLALYDPTPGSLANGTVLFAGGRGGVFKLGGSDGEWRKFGAGLPNAYVDAISITGNRMVAGTLGRGAWTIPDISGSVGTNSVTVVAAAGGSAMSLQVDPVNPKYVDLNDGQGNTLRLEIQQVQGITFTGGAGVDSVTIVGSGVAGGALSNLTFPVTVDLGGTSGDAVIVRNTVTSTPAVATITGTTLGGTAGDTLFGSGGGVTYSDLAAGTLQLELGANAADGNKVYVQSTTAGNTRIVGGGQGDTVRVGSQEGASDAGNLDGIAGTLDFDGGGGTDTFVLSDFSTSTPNANVVLGSGTITGLAGATDTALVTYENVANLTVMGSDNSGTAEVFTVRNPTAALTLFGNGGPDTANVAANILPVTVDGGAGDNQLIVDQSASGLGLTALVTFNAIIGATGASIFYLDTGGRYYAPNGGVRLIGSATGNNTYTVASTLAGSQTVVDGGAGADTYTVTASGLGGTVLLRAGGGADTFNVNGGETGNGGTGLTLDGGGGGDTAFVTGLVGNESVGVTVTGPGAATVTGIGGLISVANLATLSYDGGAGRNTMAVFDGTAGGYGSAADPLGGIVYTPSGTTAGRFVFARGAVGPAIVFNNLNGRDGDGLIVTGANGDTLTVLGASDNGLATNGETTALDGSDTITASDSVVTLVNRTLGYLRAVAVGTGANGLPSVSNLVVLGGNEAGTRGDAFTVTPSSRVNILVDGGAPTRSPGDSLTVSATVPVTLARIGTQTRAVTSTGQSVAFTGFESVTTSTGSAIGGAGRTGQILAVGADEGGGPRVTVYDAGTQAVLTDFFAYEPTFTGGVRVATGDVNGDGVPDIVVGAGYDGGPRIRVYDGVTFGLIADFFAYEPSFRGGVYVAVGDLTGTGKGEIVVGAGLGGGPLVRTFDGSGNLLSSFFAYAPTFRGGVRVATGDVNGDGADDIVTGAGPGGGPAVEVFSGKNLAPIDAFQAFDANTFTAGVFVAAADLNGDGAAEVIVGPGGTQSSTVVVRQSGTHQLQAVDASAGNTVVDSNLAGSPDSQRETGIRVAASTIGAAAGKKSFVTSRGPGYASQLNFYAGSPPSQVATLQAFESGFTGGVFVG